MKRLSGKFQKEQFTRFKSPAPSSGMKSRERCSAARDVSAPSAGGPQQQPLPRRERPAASCPHAQRTGSAGPSVPVPQSSRSSRPDLASRRPRSARAVMPAARTCRGEAARCSSAVAGSAAAGRCHQARVTRLSSSRHLGVVSSQSVPRR